MDAFYDILNHCIDTKMVKAVCDFYEKNNNGRVTISQILFYTIPKIKKFDEKYNKMRELSTLKSKWDWKELASELKISRQTLYNWNSKGWFAVNMFGKPDLEMTIKLWYLMYHIKYNSL